MTGPDRTSEMDPSELVRGVAGGAGVGIACIAGVTALALVVSPGPLVEGSFGTLALYLGFVALAGILAGWLAGRIALEQPFPAAALTGIVLGVTAFVGGRLVAAILGGPLWIGGAVAGIAPGGAIVGGLFNWAGREE